jgi:hypothetical protein
MSFLMCVEMERAHRRLGPGGPCAAWHRPKASRGQGWPVGPNRPTDGGQRFTTDVNSTVRLSALRGRKFDGYDASFLPQSEAVGRNWCHAFLDRAVWMFHSATEAAAATLAKCRHDFAVVEWERICRSYSQSREMKRCSVRPGVTSVFQPTVCC